MSGDRVLSKRKAYLKRQQEIHDSFIRKKEARKPAVEKRKRKSRKNTNPNSLVY